MKSLLFPVLSILAAVVVAHGGVTTTPQVFAANAPLVVSNLNDSGPGSLRSAISTANTTAGPDTITFGAGVNGTINVTNSLNIQDEGTTIDATGHEIVVDGSLAPAPNNIFQVAASSATFVGFTVQNAKSNGISVSPAFTGGCVGTIANLTLTRMTIQQNTGESGLLICAASAAAISITDSEFLGNNVGVSLRPGVAGGTDIHNSRFVGNTMAGLSVNSGPDPFVPGGTVDAEQNWWGCGAGPGNPGCDGLIHGELVDYTPHLAIDTIRVTNLNDSGDGSLRRAVDEANQRPGPDTIRFAVSGTIALTGAGMNLTNEGTTIDATGRRVIVDGALMNTPSNIFQVGASSAGFIGFTIQHARNNAISVHVSNCTGAMTALVVTGMTFRENTTEASLSLCASGFASTTITNNRFISNNAAIGVAPGSSAAATAHDNSFTGNTWGVVNFGAGTFDATNNWWGCNAGPGNAGCDAAGSNVDYSGFVNNALVVTNLNDSGAGSLRDAIQQANANAGPDTISFAVGGVITLSGPLVISGAATTIDAGSHAVTLVPSGSFPALQINASGTTLVGLSVSGGQGISVRDANCASYLDGLSLDRLTVTGSTGQSLNICARSVTNVSITNSSFTGSTNTAVQICHCVSGDTTFDLADVEVLNTVIAGNKAGLQLGIGGGTFPVTLTRLLIENSAISGAGIDGPPGQGFSYTGGSMSATEVNVARNEFNSHPNAPAFAIEANGNISGSGFSLLGNQFFNSVLFSGASGGSLSGITIEGNTIAAPVGRPGLQITAENGSISNVGITANPSITGGTVGIFSQGVLIGSLGGSSTVSNVRITDNGTVHSAGSSGIAFFGATSLAASDLTVERNASITGSSTGAGVFIGSFTGSTTVDGVSISNNGSIVGGLAGISIGNTAATAVTSGLSINGHADLRATAAGGAAIDYRGYSVSGGNTISDNVISGSAIGVKFANGVAATPMSLNIFGNQLLNNTTAGLQFQNGTEQMVDVHLNAFVGNAVGLQAFTVAASNAEWNWWGCTGGPGSAGCDTVTGNVDFDPWLQAPITSARTSATVSLANTSGSASVIPDGTTSTPGATATMTTDSSEPATVTVSTYAGNPATTVFDTGGGYVDIYVSDPIAVTSVTSAFYYPVSVTGQAEADLVLLYFNEVEWVPVLGSAGVAPVKDTTDNLDGSVSGGRFTVTFDASSTPQAAELNGTILTMTAVVGPVVGPSAPVPLGLLVTVQATVNDSAVINALGARVDWGDNTSSTASLGLGSADLSASHPYTEPGVYTVRVTDALGKVVFATLRYIVVYDPSAGFVTGGGWFNSPLRAYAPDHSLYGKATFGFVSRYKKGATAPTGNTEFQFKAGNLNFSSASYDWLVVNGHKSQYKGSGTINGGGDYRFMLTAIDGQIPGGGGTDKIRIRIWNNDGGGIVYDNQMGNDETGDFSTELGGGSIVIHK